MQVELDDGPHELRRERELRRQRLGERGEMGALEGLEAAGVENPAQVRVVAEWMVMCLLLWKLGAEAPPESECGPVGAAPSKTDER